MWLIIALFARFIEGTSAVFDKKLLSASYKNPTGYAFWAGILSLFTVVLIPFGFHFLPFALSGVAIFSGMLFFAAIFLYLSALAVGEVSSTNILLGVLTPLATLLWSVPILGIGLRGYQLIAFALFILAGVLLYFSEKPEARLKIIFLLGGAAILLGASSALTKYVFLHTNFVSGFVMGRFGEAAAALLLLVSPAARRHIFRPGGEGVFHYKTAYFFNRAYAACGSVFVYYAIALGVPAMVDATAAARYLFVFVGGWLWLQERFGGKILLRKMAAFIIVCLAIFIIAAGDSVATAPNPNRPISWGVTFSQKFSVMMGLDWQKNYDAILDDLGAKKLRLIAYWDLIEKNSGQFDFSALDYQFSRAEKHGAKIILALGLRVPRWPECHEPPWAANSKLETRNSKLLDYIKEVVSRYKNSPALEMWQIENEPFLSFGECPSVDAAFLDREIALVKSLDPAHKILITDSGELSLWYKAAGRGDVFGTTMYRRVNNRFFGNIDYHLPPDFFRAKEAFSRYMTRSHSGKTKKYIVIELGAEPWLHHQLYETTLAEQLAVFDLPFFEDTVRYAKDAGFSEYYLWGAEWWWWMKTKHGNNDFWEYAKTIMAQSR